MTKHMRNRQARDLLRCKAPKVTRQSCIITCVGGDVGSWLGTNVGKVVGNDVGKVVGDFTFIKNKTVSSKCYHL